MRQLIYKAISDRFFFHFSLICSYINIKCLSGNKLLHYTWYGYKSLVQTSEKALWIRWMASRELHGQSGALALAEGSREVAPGASCAALSPAGLREQRICRCSYQAPLKKTGCPELASVLLVFRACPGNLSREAMSEGIIPSGWLTSSDKAGRERDWLVGFVCSAGATLSLINNAPVPAPLTSWFQFVTVTRLITFPVLAGLRHTLGLLCPTHLNHAVTWPPDWWSP